MLLDGSAEFRDLIVLRMRSTDETYACKALDHRRGDIVTLTIFEAILHAE